MSNRGVTYVGPGNVEVRDISFPDLVLREGPGVPKSNVGRKCEHGVILKVIVTNICGSDKSVVFISSLCRHQLIPTKHRIWNRLLVRAKPLAAI